MSTDTQTTGKISSKPRAPQKARELLPESDYLLEVTWVEKGMSANGKPRLSFRFKVAAGALEGKKCYEDCYLTEEAMWKVSNLAALCGLPEEKEIDPNDPKDLINSFQGKTFRGTIKHETYKNKDGVEVKAQRVLWGPPPGSKRDPSTPDAGTHEDKKEDVPF